MPFVLTHLPKSAFTVKVVAVTTSGAKLVSTKRYSDCAKPSPKNACVSTTSLTVRVPHRAGTRVVLVRAYVNGRRKAVVHGRRVTQLTLTRLPQARFTLKLVTLDSRGRRGVSRPDELFCVAHLRPDLPNQIGLENRNARYHGFTPTRSGFPPGRPARRRR